MKNVLIQGAVLCPGCGCEDTSLTFLPSGPPEVVCYGCLRWWTAEVVVREEIEGEERPRHPTDAQ